MTAPVFGLIVNLMCSVRSTYGLSGIPGVSTSGKPNDSAVQFSLAQSAEQAGDYATAIKAYQQFIKLAPDDPNVPAIKRQIALLKAQQQIQPTAQPSG